MNDVIIEFATSFYTQYDYNNNRIPTGKNVGDFKQYHVVTGSVFNYCYNETLDSATVLLSHIFLPDRLTNLKAYQYVCVCNLSTNKKHTYLIDNFNETENNITEHIFSYTINLMSETKILEKIQCPNRAVTHKVENGQISKKTIYQLIKENMELYCPKVKYTDDDTTWYYKPIIEVPDSGSFYDRFNVTSADLPLTVPTMRQLLTVLMQQVGCIPTVENGVLGFLDFQLEAQPFGDGDFTVNATVNKITKSLSSDSFANTLVDMSSNVLDTGNEVICETLGFRDKENVLLKQTENLTLETKFPIYKVNKFYIKNFAALSNISKPVKQTWQTRFIPEAGFPRADYIGLLDSYFMQIHYLTEDHTFGGITYHGRISIQFGSQGTGAKLRNPIAQNGVTYNYWAWRFEDVKVHCCKYEGNTAKEIAVLDKNSDVLVMSLTGRTLANFSTDAAIVSPGEDGYSETDIYLKDALANCSIVWIEGTIVPCLQNYDTVGGNLHLAEQVDYANYLNDYNYINNEYEKTGIYACVYRDRDNYLTYGYNSYAKIRGFFKIDITPLLVENSVRNNLNNNFLQMNSASDIDDLSHYLYGTVGYSIGSTSIVGFSLTYTVGTGTAWGWWTFDYTYIENILEFLKTHYSSSDFDFEYAEYAIDNYPLRAQLTSEELQGITILSAINNFSYLLFDLYYQPLNSFNLKFVKKREDIDFSLEQLNTSANGLSDFDRMSIHQQEQVDRIGNEVLVIHQRTKNFNEIQNFDNGPLYFEDDLNRDEDYFDENEDTKHIIFKIQYTIKNFYYEASYTASKDSILKNYFTSIRTKYRAYQYVGYNQSVLRKENNLIYVRIGEDYYNGDDKIRLGNWSVPYNYSSNLEYLKYFIDGVINENSNEKNKTINVLYEKDYDKDYSYKNEVSLITNSNSFAIIYQDFENASPGVWLNPHGTQDYDSNNKLGGIAQGWYMFTDSFSEKPQLLYCFNTTFANTDLFFRYSNLSLEFAAQYLPKDDVVNDTFIISENNFVAFTLCDDNSVNNFSNARITTYKDYAEQIQRTVQFIYYTTSDSIRWTEHFVRNGSFVRGESFIDMGYIGVDEYDMFGHHTFDSDDWFNNEEQYILSGIHSLSNVVYIDTTGELPTIKINWENIDNDYVKVVGITQRNITYGWAYYYDIVAFKNPGDGSVKTYYVSLNDTKSDYIMSRDETNNILYRKTKVGSNTLIRTVQNKFSYRTGNATGIANLVCHKGSISGPVVNDGDIVNKDDELYFVSTPSRGYINTIVSNANPLIVDDNVVGVNYVSVARIAYELIGVSENGTVKFYRTSTSSTEITQSYYGEIVYYVIVPNEHYVAPTSSAGYIQVNDTNFVVDDINETATIELENCTLQQFTLSLKVSKNVSVVGTIGGNQVNYGQETTQEINLVYGTSYNLRVVANTNYYVPINGDGGWVSVSGVLQANENLGESSNGYTVVGETISISTYSTLPQGRLEFVGKYAVLTNGKYYLCELEVVTNILYDALTNRTVSEVQALGSALDGKYVIGIDQSEYKLYTRENGVLVDVSYLLPNTKFKVGDYNVSWDAPNHRWKVDHVYFWTNETSAEYCAFTHGEYYIYYYKDGNLHF